MLKFYTKPVLTNEENTAYLKNFFFKISLEKANIIQNSNMIDISLKPETNSQILLDKIKSGKAKCGIKISSSMFSEFKEIDNLNENIEIRYSCDKLKRIDQIECTAFILSNGENTFEWTNELSEDYDPIFTYKFLDNEIMAVSNVEKIDYKAYGEPFIIFSSETERNGKGIAFSVDTPNKIQVKIGTELNESLAKLRRAGEKYESKDIIDAFTAFNSIVYALTKMILNPEKDFKEKEWYQVLNFNFKTDNYENLDEFVSIMSNGGSNSNIDLDEIYRVAQIILNNCLETKLIEAGKK